MNPGAYAIAYAPGFMNSHWILTVVYLYEIQVYKLNRNESSASSIWRRRYLILQNSYNWSYPSGQNSIKNCWIRISFKIKCFVASEASQLSKIIKRIQQLLQLSAKFVELSQCHNSGNSFLKLPYPYNDRDH